MTAVEPARAVVVSAAESGHGKTLATLAIVRALVAAGARVQPYKIGPDYIDARFYARVARRPAYNLDLWLDGEAGVRDLVAATRGDADVLVGEGMMGLYDGANDGSGSTADVARALDARVVVVLDCWSASQSVAAVALGLRDFDPRVRVAGAILNRVAGDAHERAVRAACARAGIAVLAAIPNDAAFAAADRTLGLDVAAVDARAAAVDALAERLRATPGFVAWFLGDAWAASRAAPRATPEPGAAPSRARGPRIAYAHDEAFWFTYAETLAALRFAGAEVVPFSPLRDASLPDGTCGVWIGGGYPEDVAADLEANVAMRASLAAALRAGMPAYAECGGLMYLAERLDTERGSFAMVGALAGATSIAEPKLHIGYREATVACETPLDRAGTRVRGYEFHYATARLAEPAHAYALDGGGFEGAVRDNVVAGFLHRRFLPGSASIARFVAACTPPQHEAVPRLR